MFLDKIIYRSLLYDFYSGLLTDKQKLFYGMYHLEDLSLNEIAVQYEISPQAVRDLVKRTEALLEMYEEKLSLVTRYNFQKDKIFEAKQYVEDNLASETGVELTRMLEEILDLA